MTALLAMLLAQAAPAPGVSPAPVSVVATASKAEVTVGETFTVEVKATGPAGTEFTFAGEAEGDAFALRTPAPDPKAAAPLEPGTQRYEAAVYALGDATVPPIPVRYRLPDGTSGETSSLPIAVKVVSLLPKDPREQKLADIRPPEPVSIGRAFWFALGSALVLLAALATWIVRRRRRPEPGVAPAVPALAPDAEALRTLDALLASGRLARGELRPFYIELTTIAKRYLERRLAAPVLEMTTAETLAFLRAHPHGSDLVGVVREVAESADRIKFAKGRGLVEEAERHLAAVRALVGALEARLAPPPAASGKAA